ncbi:hypothetical protein JGU71_02145 [Antrihabitans sp. YC3-6]|uniref:Fenitrothion hydrolase n=1 Tax=Antrihabitans stalagmiti TaxID=2799499 RepID=A0A934NM18_9NOCA|nr:hypothetical protein [Antrihabitans stalagmiti]MBJ8337677.1 hypothetical protein [Antrihabitans stalagmiti]
MILAHGVGGRSDLPVPLWLALYAGAFAVLVSFVALTVLWKTPRLRGAAAGRPLPTALTRFTDARSTRITLQLLALAALLTLIAVAWFGPDSSADNPAPTWFYVWFWVGLVALSLVFGPVYRVANPLRLITSVVRGIVGTRVPTADPAALRRLEYRPAVVGLFAFLWLELVYPLSDSPRAVAGFVVVYSLAQVVGGVRFGLGWFERGDAFEVYFTLVSRLSPIGRRNDGRIGVRNPLDGLLVGPSDRGLTAVVLLALGSTTFDGVTRLPFWSDLRRDLSRLQAVGVGTVGLLLTVAVVAIAYVGTIWLTRPYLKKSVDGRTQEPYAAFVHSLVPIMVGYTVAHYFSFAVFQGQAGWLLLDGGGRIDYTVVSTDVIAVVQIAAIVGGHVLGVASAHDRAVSILRTGYTKVGQFPMLALMVAYTVVGIQLVSGV